LAAIVRRNKSIIKIVANDVKTGPSFKRVYKDGIDYNNHAETLAIKFCRSGDTIEVVRFTKKGGMSMSKPCWHCQQALRRAGIKEVIYTDWEGNPQVWKS